MARRLNYLLYLIANPVGVDADACNQLPRECGLNQELGLLPFFMNLPVVGKHSSPINLIQLGQITTVFKIIGAGIGKRKCPPKIVGICPSDRLQQVRFQMEDWPLPAAVCELRVICSENQVKHDRTRAEVEGHTLSNE